MFSVEIVSFCCDLKRTKIKDTNATKKNESLIYKRTKKNALHNFRPQGM